MRAVRSEHNSQRSVAQRDRDDIAGRQVNRRHRRRVVVGDVLVSTVRTRGYWADSIGPRSTGLVKRV